MDQFNLSSFTGSQARNMSIGEHRHCCVTFKIIIRICMGKKSAFCNREGVCFLVGSAFARPNLTSRTTK